MPPGIGASGFAGLALETVSGTYLPPTKYFPFESESLAWQQDTTFRRPIRQSADNIGAVLGNGHTEGDISMEALEDIVPYFLYAARTTPVKTGAGPNYTYTFKGSAAALPTKTLSITIIRNGAVFAYTGVVVSSFTFSIEDMILKFSASLIGRDEASQSAPTPTFVNTAPFGAGQYTLQLNAATLADADSFSFQVEDNGAAQNRIGTTRAAAYVNYGERNVTVSMDRDFIDRTEYDTFKSLTSQALHLDATKSATNKVSIDVPVGFREEYAIALGGQGDLLRVSNAWTAVIDGTGNAYTVTVLCQENIT
jgi:hypothetical protein